VYMSLIEESYSIWYTLALLVKFYRCNILQGAHIIRMNQCHINTVEYFDILSDVLFQPKVERRVLSS